MSGVFASTSNRLSATHRNRKPWWRSKTLWVNGLAILGGCAAVIAGVDPPVAVLKWCVIVQGFANVVLRVVTKEGIR